MRIKPDITNASDAVWCAAVEREHAIAALAAAPQVSRSEVEESRRRPRSWNSAGPWSIGWWPAIGAIPIRAPC